MRPALQGCPQALVYFLVLQLSFFYSERKLRSPMISATSKLKCGLVPNLAFWRHSPCIGPSS